MSKKLFVPVLFITALMFAYSPIAIANAPYESTMRLVQKIFYYHLPAWMALGVTVTVCTIASAVHLFTGSAKADRIAVAAAEVTVVFGLFGLVSGSLWGRKAWGVWWQWDARLTMAFLLELIFFGYLLVRAYGGPGSEKLASAMGIFGGATAPFVYKSVDWWRTVHPKTSVMTTLGETSPEMWAVVWFCALTLLLFMGLLLAARIRLEEQRAALDRLYLAAED
ncbi:MAG: cytochrome c biogenesis protein CcsA [Vicinamibacterales bacterium]